MIHFNELYVTEDGQHLVIDVEVDGFSIYEGTVIDRIKVDLGENLIDIDGISNKAMTVWDKDEEVIYLDSEENQYQSIQHIPRTSALTETHVRLCLSSSDLNWLGKNLNLNEHLFVVRVEAQFNGNSEALATMQCDWENNAITGLAFNGYPMYESVVDLLNSYGDDCDDANQKKLVDYILHYYGFIFALRTGDLQLAVKYWNEYLRGVMPASTSLRHCGCHGTYR